MDDITSNRMLEVARSIDDSLKDIAESLRWISFECTARGEQTNDKKPKKPVSAEKTG